MKTIIKTATALILAMTALPGKAQTTTICPGSSAVLSPTNTAGLTSPSYSMNPGGVTSSNPSFTVTPGSTTTYTLYVTGTNSSSAVVTTSNVVTVQVASAPVASVAPVSQTVGCGPGVVVTATGNCISPIGNITHALYTAFSPQPFTGSGQTFVFNPPPGTSTYVVTDNTTGCVTTKTVNVISVAGNYATFDLTSSSVTFSLGCGTKSVTDITVANANTFGAVNYTLLTPGYSGGLSYSVGLSNTFTVNTPGTHTVIVRNPVNGCEVNLPVVVSQNTMVPTFVATALTQTLSCFTPSVVLAASSTISPIVYNWNFLNGVTPISLYTNSIAVNTTTAGASVPAGTVINTYSLTVQNGINQCVSQTVVTMYQNTRPPVASILGPSSGSCQNLVTLANTSISGILPGTFPGSLGVAALLWEGPAPQPTLGLSSTYTAQTLGVYTMTARDDNNGCVSTATYNLTGALLSPSAAFVHTVTTGVAVFNDASTGTSSGSIYYWDFNDGTVSMMQNPTHTFASSGAYLVKLKVTNPGGCVDSVIQSVNVSGIACVANSNFSMVPTATAQVWNAIPDYPWNIIAASWDWGDGSGSTTLYDSHQYAAAGMYNICLSVTVSCAASSSACASYSVYRVAQEAMIVKVNVVAPALIMGLPAVKAAGQLSWNIAPNPNAGEFNLNFEQTNSEPVRMVISDLTGRVVHDQLLKADAMENTIRTEQLPSGMYLVTLETGQLKTTKRMVIAH